MSHARSLDFDDLEGRKLLTAAHHAAVHPDHRPASAAAHVAGPIALDGTLVVDAKAAKTSTDAYGDLTKETPVHGFLNGIGAVHGIWAESADLNGTYLGPDKIQLNTPRGSFMIAFDDTTFGQGIQTPQGTVYDVAAQQLVDGTGAFARVSESGSIQQATNANESVVQSFTLSSNRRA